MADKKEYFVKTFTSSKKNAGTDANVFITLTGEGGTTSEVQLKAEGKQDPFERGKMDIFRIWVDKDPGTLTKIRIRHDNKGLFPGWRLDKVSVIEEGTGVTSVFPCFQCLSKLCGGIDLELPVSKDTKAQQLRINKVDFLREQNAPLHHTDEYDSPLVVVRRGAPFLLKLNFDHGFDRLKDNIVLEFRTGNTDKLFANKGTEVIVLVGDGPGEHGWEAELSSVKEGEPWAVVSVTPPAQCPVAKWRMSVETISEGLSYETRYDSELVILFNPWCEDDEVYLEGDDKRGEYVLREFGKVYQSWKVDRNTWMKVFNGKPWNYGQFEPEILEACLGLLDRSGVSVMSRGSPVAVTRVVSQMVNSQDDNGVLEGNWSGDYSGGVAPWIWNGSVRILQQYHRTKEPVSYGQCWVFSAVTTTVLRCLGIPARSVTNFSSAHDTDGSLTIDKVVDEYGNLLEDSDSVWNFHVWNEAWMARADLPKGYGGWQALDATPQEKSSGIFCCGPASVNAIKHGEVQYNFDARFIFAEVNADKVHWCQQRDGSCYVAGMEKGTIGRFISTKAVGINDREDITENYKFPEGSEEERVAVQRAAQYGSRRSTGQNPYQSATSDVEFSLKDDGSVPINEDADCTITLKNTSSEIRNVTLLYVANIVKYTGVQHRKLRKEKIEVELKPKSTESVNVAVNPMESMDHMEDKCALKFLFMAHVQETGQTYATERVVDVDFPDLDVKVLGKTDLGQQVAAAITFTNPLDRLLTNCEFNIEGPGLQKPKTVFFRNIRPGETVKIEERFTPKRAGLKEIVANFSSSELCDITGEAEVQVGLVLHR
ncbi:coagulation factor XIII A chain-like [Branchiostoma floridae x Branchiostoma japonicum]